MLLRCIAPIGNPDSEIISPWPGSLHLGCAWPPSQKFGGVSGFPSVVQWGVVVWGSNARSHGPCVPKMVAWLRLGWFSSTILSLRCPIVLSHMWGIASPHGVIYGWNNLVHSLPCLAPGRALRPMDTGKLRHSANIWLLGLVEPGMKHCRVLFKGVEGMLAFSDRG